MWKGLKALHSAGWGVAFTLLAGCAAAPIAVEQKLTGEEGAVVLKLVTNGQSSFDPAETLASIRIKRDIQPANGREVAGDVVTLVRTRSVTNTTAVFSGMVAPGGYTVLNATGVSGNTTYTYPIGGFLSHFEVKPGEVTLLGTVLVQPLEGSRFAVGYVPPEAELTETFEQLFPALAGQTRGKPIHSFDLTPEMAKRVELAPRFKFLASAANGFAQADQGAFYASGKMGRVSWRPAGEKRWRSASVGTWKEVMSVRPYRGGLLAAGEEGLLRHSADDGKTWVALTPPEKGLIFTAEPLPNGKVLALVRRDSDWTAYLSDDALAGAWRKLGSFAHERSINLPSQNHSAVVLGNQIGLMMSNGEMQLVDGDSGRIERRSSGLSAISLSTAPDGMLVLQGVQVLVRTTLISTDAGKTWVDLNTSRFVAAIAFADRQKAYAVAPIAPGVFPGEYGLMTSRDGGRTWAKTGVVPNGGVFDVRELIVDRVDGSLVAVLRNGSVMRSADEGAAWIREL